MKLHEEFKRYENLWEEKEVDPVDQILWDTPNIEISYEGFDDEQVEDRFDPFSYYGHYQVGRTYHYHDFEYPVDAVSIFEILRDDIIEKYADRHAKNELINKYKELLTAYENSTDETEAEACQALDLFLAKNVTEFAEIFEDELKSYYEDSAKEWAIENPEYTRNDWY